MSTTARKGSLLVIFLTVFIDLLGFGIVLPLLPIYAQQFAGISGFSQWQAGLVIGLLMSSFSLMQFLFLPFWGRMSDRYGRRPILLIGLAGSAIFYGLFGIFTVYRSLLGLFIARIGAGIAGATISTAQAYIADSTTKESRNKGMAIVGAAFALGFTVGPMLGSIALFVGDRADLSPWPGFLAAALSGAAFLLALWQLPESWQPSSDQSGRKLFDWNALWQARNTPSVSLLLLGTFISVFSFANFESTLSLQIKGFVDAHSEGRIVSPLLVAVMNRISAMGFKESEDAKFAAVFAAFAYLGIVLTLAQGFLVRRLAGRISEGMMIAIGSVAAVLGFVLLGSAASSGNALWFLIAMAIEVIGFAFVTPALQSLISRRTDPRYQGGILGLAQSFSSLGRIVGPIVGLSLVVRAPALPYWLAAAVLAIGSVFMALGIKAGRDFESTN